MALPRAAQAQGTCQGSLAASTSAAPALAKFIPAAERSGVVFHSWLDPRRPAAHLVVENTNAYPVAVSFQAELRGSSGPVSSATRCVWIRAGEFVRDLPAIEYPATLTAVRIGSAQIARLDPPRPAADTAPPRVSSDRARPRPARPLAAVPDPDSVRAARAAATRDSLRASRRAAARRDSAAEARRVAARRDSVAEARRVGARRDSVAATRRAAARRDSVAEARRVAARRDSVEDDRRIAARPDTTPRRAAPDSVRVNAAPQPIPRDTSGAVAVFRDSAPTAPDTLPSIERARALRAAGMLNEARAAYAEAVRAAPSEPVHRAELGSVLLRLGRFAEAEGQFRTAVQLDRSVPSYHAGLGAALEGSRRWAAAEAALRDAQRLAPRDPAIRASLQRVAAARLAMSTPMRREGPPRSATHAASMFSVAAGALLVPAGVVLGIGVAGAAFLLGWLVPLGAVRRAAARLRRRE